MMKKFLKKDRKLKLVLKKKNKCFEVEGRKWKIGEDGGVDGECERRRLIEKISIV